MYLKYQNSLISLDDIKKIEIEYYNYGDIPNSIMIHYKNYSYNQTNGRPDEYFYFSYFNLHEKEDCELFIERLYRMIDSNAKGVYEWKDREFIRISYEGQKKGYNV